MRKIEVIILGTASSIPTKDRNSSSIVIIREGEYFMFDCGEGTQRQMMKARLGFNRPMKIFITHLHGDHVLGLPGLLQTMSFLDRSRPLEIYGPRGLKKFIECTLDSLRVELTFDLKVKQIVEGVVYERRDLIVRAKRGKHSILTYAYRFEEKERPGRFNVEKALALGVPRGPLWKKLQMGETVKVRDKIVKPEDVLGPPRKGLSVGISGDTRPVDDFSEFFKDVDLLIFEATYSDDHIDIAKEYLHSTAWEAAEIAKLCNVKGLVLVHFSNRYRDVSKLVKEANEIFPNVIEGKDLLRIEVTEEGIKLTSSSFL